MAGIDYKLIAGLPDAYMRGYQGAQKQQLYDLGIQQQQRTMGQENALQQLFASRQPGEEYGTMAQRGAQMGVAPGATMRLDQMAMQEKNNAAQIQQQQDERMRKDAVEMYKAAQANVKLGADQGDQRMVDGAVRQFREWAENSGNPYGQRMADMVQSVRVKGKGVEITSLMDGKDIKQLYPDAKPGTKYQVVQSPDGMKVKEQAPPKGTDFKSVMEFRKEVKADKVVEDHTKLAGQLDRMESVWRDVKTRIAKGESPSNIATDQVLITTLNKILDPTSVVRESEYARTPQDQAFWQRVLGLWPKLNQGGVGLTNQEREALVHAARVMYSSSEQRYKTRMDYYNNIAQQYGIDAGTNLPLSPAGGAPRFKIISVK